MISLVIKFLTIEFIIIALSTFKLKKEKNKSLFKTINACYANILNSSGACVKKLMVIAGILINIQIFLIAFQKCCIEGGREVTGINILMTIVIWGLILLVMYFIVGGVLAVFLKTINILGHIKDQKIFLKMTISFLLLVLFTFFCMASENEMRENLPYLLLGLITCYVLNIQILLKVIQNPFCLIGNKKQYRSEDKVLITFTSILILLMFVVNMYLLVLWTYYSHDGAYCCSMAGGEITKWKLLYYTIISFTTIGYGDIYPAIFESQIVAILIAITSVLCLIVYVSSVISAKNEILNDHANDG